MKRGLCGELNMLYSSANHWYVNEDVCCGEVIELLGSLHMLRMTAHGFKKLAFVMG